MGKIIISPVKNFAGTVTIPARLTLPQVGAWEAATAEQTELIQKLIQDKVELYSTYEVDKIFVPVLCELVEKWELKDLATGEPIDEKLSLDTFPATPRKAAHELVDWLTSEVRKVFLGETEIPNV